MEKEVHHTVHTNMVYFLIANFVILFLSRVLVNFFDLPPFLEGSRDIDFRILLLGLKNGLTDFYNPVVVPQGVPDWPPYYLYFWYFIFFPMGLVPFEIGIQIWDILRLILSCYIVLKGYKIIKNRTNLLWFYFTIWVGFIIDSWYNNCNFLIIFFLIMSYNYLEKSNMWLSGIFFALSTIKINSVLFIPTLLLIRKIKFKDLVYYIVPFVVLCLPYMIFPDYLLQMLNNWSNSTPGIQGLTPLDPIIWKMVQPSHLMFLGFMLILCFEYLERFEKGHKIRTIIVSILILFYIYISITVWILPLIFIY
ncbi:MAG: DUF2029 domain-containing protein [Candidatus Lokiarchaeota archaeon]|nr:DUF2029 domain-containing protein [Candidatus Lokiarchaeota archaeon]